MFVGEASMTAGGVTLFKTAEIGAANLVVNKSLNEALASVS